MGRKTCLAIQLYFRSYHIITHFSKNNKGFLRIFLKLSQENYGYFLLSAAVYGFPYDLGSFGEIVEKQFVTRSVDTGESCVAADICQCR